jgi:hypothetical protein
MRPAQLANQDRQSGRKPVTKPTATATAKTKAIRMPGKERPAASRLGIQGPPTPEPHPRNTGMIRHGVGCRIEETLYVKKVDEEFFE